MCVFVAEDQGITEQGHGKKSVHESVAKWKIRPRTKKKNIDHDSPLSWGPNRFMTKWPDTPLWGQVMSQNII